ncbi:MAG: hypothetical protein ABSA90_18185 [Xanthobacteraceae bacterium]|jgi:hypothetical protein
MGVPFNQGNSAIDLLLARRILSPLVTGLFIGLVLTLELSEPASAYRPFDGTNAAVVDLGEAQIQLQPAGGLSAGSRNVLTGPYAVFDYGFAERWELVLEGAGQAPPAGGGPTPVSDEAFLKYVVQPGVLQGKPGPSFATEFGPLLPNIGGSSMGFEWEAIVSQRWEWGTVHLNLDPELTRDHHGALFLDAIIEGPRTWSVRPVLEIYSDSVVSQSQTYSALVGAIWQVRDNLAFDMGLRYALVNGRPVNELRAGVTFGFPLSFGRPNSAESSSTAPFSHR